MAKAERDVIQPLTPGVGLVARTRDAVSGRGS